LAITGPGCNPGWFSEASIHEILYDIVDANVDQAGHDQLSMSFGAVYAVLRNAHRNTPALTSIFPFIHALKTANPADAALIDAIVASQNIATINDAYGDGESNDAGSLGSDVLPIYRPISVNGAVVNVCSTDEFGDSNKLGSRQFLRFSVGAAATHTFSAVATSIPAGEVADPDLVLHRNGFLQRSEEPPAGNCSAQAPANCFETFSAPLAAGEYVLEVYEYSNTQSDDSDVPPIGRTCFNVSVTQ
jgi:hypothetical protein